MFGQPAFRLEWRDQSCCSTENRMEAHVAEVKTRTPGVARDRNVWAYSRKMIAGLSDEVGQHGQPFLKWKTEPTDAWARANRKERSRLTTKLTGAAACSADQRRTEIGKIKRGR